MKPHQALETYLRELDPVSEGELSDLQAQQAKRQLLVRILASESVPAARPPVAGRRRRLARPGVLLPVGCVSLVVALVLALLAAPGTVRGGHRWTLLADITAAWHASPVDYVGVYLLCPSVNTCYAAGRIADRPALEVTRDGGRQWVRMSLPGVPVLTTLTCPTADACELLARVAGRNAFLETTDAGATWKASPFPASLVGEAALSCVSTRSCVAAAGGNGRRATALLTDDAGRTWSRSTLSVLPTNDRSQVELTGLECHVGGACILLGSVLTHGDSTGPLSALQGHRVVLRMHPPGSRPAPRLPRTLHLAENGQRTRAAHLSWLPFAFYSVDGGSTWHAGVVPAGFVPGYDFSCAQTRDCIAVGAEENSTPEVIASVDGGRRWTRVTVPGSSTRGSYLNWVACSDGAGCWVTGGTESQHFVAQTTDLGRRWQEPPLPARVDGVGNISCPALSRCYALGSASRGSHTSSALVFLSYTD